MGNGGGPPAREQYGGDSGGPREYDYGPRDDGGKPSRGRKEGKGRKDGKGRACSKGSEGRRCSCGQMGSLVVLSLVIIFERSLMSSR